MCVTEKGHNFIGFDPHPDVKIKAQIFRVECFSDQIMKTSRITFMP